MIQRIQTLYLLIVTAMMALMLALPLGRFLVGDEVYVLRAFTLSVEHQPDVPAVMGTAYLGVLLVLAAVVPFVATFFFKNRLLQIRLCFMEFVFLLGVQGFVIFYLVHTKNTLEGLMGGVTVSYSLLDILPVVALILNWLALRGIVRDQKLIKSLNRMR